MRTVPYSSVVDKISGYLGENAGMSAEDLGLANRLINTRVKGAWEYYMWPELMGIEQRQFAPSFNAATLYSPTNVVYYPPTFNYYQALVPTIGNLPTLDGAVGTENSGFWAECRGSYSGEDWGAGNAYSVGDDVRDPNTNQFYQCTVAHTSAGASIDVTKFGLLTPFVRALPLAQVDGNGNALTVIGEIQKIWDRDPDANYDARAIPFRLRGDFALVRGTVSVIWPEFRLRPNSYSGANWVNGTAYTPGTQVFYNNTDYYVNTVATASAPPTDGTHWELVAFPYIFQEYTAQSVYATMVAKEEEAPEDFNVELAAGWPFLQAELQKIERQQGQVRQLNVVNARPGGW